MSENMQLTTAAFDAQIAGDTPVMVDFWAPWCGPCRMVGPIIEELAGEYEGRAKIFKVNVDEEGALAERYNVMSIPTVIVFKNGEMVEKAIGAKPKQAFKEMLDKHVS